MKTRSFCLTLILHLIAFGLALWPSGTAAAQPHGSPISQTAVPPPGVTIRLIPERYELTVGDPLELTLEVSAPPDYRVTLTRLERQWGTFEVLSQTELTTSDSPDGIRTTRAKIIVTLFAPGEHTTPPLTAILTDHTGQSHEISPLPVTLRVTSVLDENDQELRDIKPQAEMQVPFPWLLALGALLLAAALFILGRFIYRRWKNRRHPETSVPKDRRTPYEIITEELERIESQRLLEQGRVKEHYTQVTDSLRRYLETACSLSAIDRTTNEIRRSLRQSSISPDAGKLLIDILYEGDMVKFARYVPDASQSSCYLERTRRWAAEMHQSLSASDTSETS